MDLRYLSHLARLGATDVHPGGRRATERLIWMLQLQPGMRVLEVGCGTGGTLVRIATRYGALADGVDVLPEMLRAARLRVRLAGLGRRVRLFRIEPGGVLPFKPGTYDRVYTESVLGFQDEAGARQMLSEIHRVLKDDGLYVANEAIWKDSAGEETVARLNRSAVADFGLRQASEQPWRLDDWRALMHSAGFEMAYTGVLDEARDRAAAPRVRSMVTAPLRMALSEALTQSYRLSGYLQPGMLRQRAVYRRLLREHAADGEQIEARLFVLRKPSRRASG